MKIAQSILSSLILIAAAPAASAAAVLIDFGNTATTGWTQVTQASGGTITKTGLTDTLGNGNYSFTASGGGNFSDQLNPSSATWGTGTFAGVSGTALDEMQSTLGLSTTIPSTVFNDGLSNGGFTSHAVTISGLNAGQAYVIYYIGGSARNDGNPTIAGLSLNAGFSNASTTVDYYLTNFGTAAYQQPASVTSAIAVPAANLGLIKFNNVIANGSGQIQMTMQGARANINALAFAAVPEPSSASLAAIAAGLALVRRRRQ